MKTLYVNGDSWSWAHNLQDPEIWPNIVGSSLSMFCVNESMGCGSNSRIIDNLHDLFATSGKPDLIVIALTSHVRYHLSSPKFGSWCVGSLVAINDRTGDTDTAIRDWIYRNCYDIVDSVYRYYRQIWQMNNLAEKYQCPIWFFQAWDTDIENYSLMDSLDNIKEFVRKNSDYDTYTQEKYIKGFDFFRYERKKWNYVETAFKKNLLNSHLDQTGHPNKQGHRIIADTILTYIKRF